LFATGGNVYNWSNNLTGSIIEVSPSQTTTYTVNTSNIYGCEATDAVVVFVNENPAVPQLTLQGPAVFCSNEASVLTATAQANVDYEWLRNNLVQAGEFGTELTPQLSGIYAVRVTNAAGCNATSTGVSITVNPAYDLTINLQTSGGLVEYNGESLVAGVYYYNYTTISGCDSLITVNVSDPEVIGCTDENACNYNPLAGTTDNTLCVYPGCGDLNACNYNGESACFNDQLCVFALPGLNCDGSCLNDSDGDGVCDENEVAGCTDLTACNYTANATEDDGSCFWVYTYSIESSDTVTSEGNYVYSYPGNPVSTFQWSVTGGTIVGPENNSEVMVAWDGTVAGEVCVVETYLGCLGNQVCESVSITGIRSRDQESLTIYPNPSNGQFWIDAAMSTNRSYHVMDALGRTIASGTLLPGQNEVNLINISPGSYVLQSGSFRMRVIIAR
jgi:hypothetical protein